MTEKTTILSKVRKIPTTSNTEADFLGIDIDFGPLVNNQFLGKTRSLYSDILFRDSLNMLKFSGNRIKTLYDTEDEELEVDILVYDPYSPYLNLTFLLDHILNDVGSQFWNIYTVCNTKRAIDECIVKQGTSLVMSDRCKFIDVKDWRAAPHVYFDKHIIMYLVHAIYGATDFINKLRQPYNLTCDAFTSIHTTSKDKELNLEVWGVPNIPEKQIMDVGEMTESCKTLMMHYPDLNIPIESNEN